ncbi:MAG: peptidoglycan D,D-transpeptidase FtsI family protein [Micrococcales bacterium]
MRNQLPPVGGFRLRRAIGGLLLLAVIFVGRLVDLQVVESATLNKLSYDKRSVSTEVKAPRGRILDSEGKVLAETVYYYDVNVDPTLVGPFSRTVNNQTSDVSVETARTELSSLLGVSESELSTKLQGTSHYSNLAKSISPAIWRKVKALDIPWVFSESKPHRVYPNGAVAGNLLGFVGKDGEPLEGLEVTMNACLAGQNGEESYEAGVDGIKIPASTQVTKPAIAGKDVVLTINSDLQYYAQQVMTKYVQKEKADWGSAVVIEVKTGKILVAAESPTVDPNEYWKSDAADRGSRIFRALFEPGSTLKTVTAATAVDQGVANPESHVTAPYILKVLNGQETIKDSHQHPTQKLTLTGVLRDSSNTGIVQIGGQVSAETRYEYLKKFGLGQKTAVNFAGEEQGVLHNPKETDGLTNLVTMFGQGMSVTPIQTAMLYQTVANLGTRLSPTLVAGCQDDSGNLVATPTQAPVKVLSEASARSTISMLEKVVEYGGIGRTTKIAGYRSAGKTGTAQIKNGNGYGYRYAISFIGMVPAEDPQYVLAVTIYKPKTVSNSIGATPPWVAIMQQVLHEYRVPPSTTKSKDIVMDW